MPKLVVKAGTSVLSLSPDSTLAQLHVKLSPASPEVHEFAVKDGPTYGDPDADDQLIGRKVADDSAVLVKMLAGRQIQYRCGDMRVEVQVFLK